MEINEQTKIPITALWKAVAVTAAVVVIAVIPLTIYIKGLADSQQQTAEKVGDLDSRLARIENVILNQKVSQR